MATTAKCLLEAKFAETAQTTQYTAPAGSARVIVDKFTVTSVAPIVGATIAVNVVASGGAAAASNTIVQTRTITAGATILLPEMVGQILNAGDFISTIAGTASVLIIRISGREIT